MRDLIFITVFSFPILIVQTTIIGQFISVSYKPDFFLILVFWAAIRLSFIVASVFAFIVGLLMDLFSGAPLGLFAIIYQMVFLSSAYLHSVFQMENHAARAMSIFCAMAGSGCIVLLVRMLTSPNEFGWNIVQWLLLKAIITALFSVPLIPTLDWLWNGYTKLVPAR
jgi:rod shape-determining protein MreD